MEKQFIIYGAGKQGKWCMEFLKWRKMEDRVWGFCDRRYAEIKSINGKKVVSYEAAKRTGLPFLISCRNKDDADEILCEIKKDKGQGYLFEEFHKILDEDETEFLRERCAYHHANCNDQWFMDAEKREAIDVFWDKKTVFFQCFKKLDLKAVIELACGRGRHVPYYMDQAGEITLVDILEENIVICKERFLNKRNITYYHNNGYNLEELPDNSFTSLFTYDSMVHFEMMDIYEYLKDIYRVLKKGGRALFHHSNYAEDYMANFSSNCHARCFMNKDIFAYLANRTGFKILEQHVIDWAGVKNLDCITLLEK